MDRVVAHTSNGLEILVNKQGVYWVGIQTTHSLTNKAFGRSQHSETWFSSMDLAKLIHDFELRIWALDKYGSIVIEYWDNIPITLEQVSTNYNIAMLTKKIRQYHGVD